MLQLPSRELGRHKANHDKRGCGRHLPHLPTPLPTQALDAALSRVAEEGMFRQRVRVRSPLLLSYMHEPPTARIYHDVSISKLRDGVTSQTIYIVAQVGGWGVMGKGRRGTT